MGNQAGENGESRRSESEGGALRKPLRGGDRKQGKEAQRLSSQNPKLKRPKGSENSGGQKVDWIAATGRVKVRPRESRRRKRKARVSREKQLQRLKPAEDERKLQTKLIVKLREWRPKG